MQSQHLEVTVRSSGLSRRLRERVMKIGELARAARCSTQTIRFYEQAGLLPAAHRSANNYRRYSAAYIERLRFIRNCRSLDMTNKEIRRLLAGLDTPQKGCVAINALLDEHIGHVQARIEELRELKAQLKMLRAQCQGEPSSADCGILQQLSGMSIHHPVRQTHLG